MVMMVGISFGERGKGGVSLPTSKSKAPYVLRLENNIFKLNRTLLGIKNSLLTSGFTRQENYFF
jgi:hypothetical protein